MGQVPAPDERRADAYTDSLLHSELHCLARAMAIDGVVTRLQASRLGHLVPHNRPEEAARPATTQARQAVAIILKKKTEGREEK